MKYHLMPYKGIKADGKTLIPKHKRYNGQFSTCGNDHLTRSTMGNLSATEFLAKIKEDKAEGWEGETICKKCKVKLIHLINEGKAIRGEK